NQRRHRNNKIKTTRITNKKAADRTKTSNNLNRRAVPAKIKASSSSNNNNNNNNNRTSRHNRKPNPEALKILRTSRTRPRPKTNRKRISNLRQAKLRRHRRGKINSKRVNLRPLTEREKTKMRAPRPVRPLANRIDNQGAIKNSRKNRRVRVAATIKSRRPLLAKARARAKTRLPPQRRLPHRQKNWPGKSKEPMATNRRRTRRMLRN